ncbi:DUF1173 domain-containing protein [Neorhizobium sp. P12A]|uniref:DUF1173 domain-containing protein n=1 Tax=Neorhizobium sp. P12A TaxID=2268027 RepID=UPI0011EE4E61|nr:DUF1173 domain-containing protein [Neorhizobium sp. P12A]KAA0693733.1 DUF1173 domain-containing protein [Neorhizobium sp. P12A]
MRRFRLGDVECDEEDEAFQGLVLQAHGSKVRLLCLCRPSGIPMYIADIGSQLVVKRMPLTGGDHDPTCPSHEPPYELTGLGPLVNTAIKLDASAGIASLKLDFPLSKQTGSRNGIATAHAADSVKSEARKLSLRSLLHLLWHEGGLTEWTSRWTGRRHWWQVYHHLSQAARMMEIRGESLGERLYIPEPFRADCKAAIEQRRAGKLSGLYQPSEGRKKLMLLIGEIKEFGSARSGKQLVVKHMPGFRLHLEEAGWRALQRRFETELRLWESGQDGHLVAISTVAGSAGGLATVNEIALMAVTGQWLPMESVSEQRLLGHLARSTSKSVKGLRFNLPRDQPIANAILPDLKPKPMALYIVPAGADATFETTLRDMIAARPDLSAWVWRVAEGDLPPLPRLNEEDYRSTGPSRSPS